MPTLVINAPRHRRDARSFEEILGTGIGPGYAIYETMLCRVYDFSSQRVRQGCRAVLLCKDGKKRAEGIVVELKRTDRKINGIWRYDVCMKGLDVVDYRPEKLNRYGVAVIE